jgi:hypothetical protein
MCKVCDQIGTMPLEEALERIAEEMAPPRARGAEHFKPLLDKLLGTEEPARNEDAEEAWERGHRGS